MGSRLILLLFLLGSYYQAFSADNDLLTPSWKEDSSDGVIVNLWFFWSEKCPHCRDAHPVITHLDKELSWVRLHAMRVDGYPENVATYIKLANIIGQEAKSVPAFIFCGKMIVGWDSGGMVEQNLRNGLLNCRNDNILTVKNPLLTIVIAGLDSFNPCAFFVLLFLLSLLVHAGSRYRMLVIGGFFILISGIVYFTAMAAWLNLFAYIGHLHLVTLIAGLLAVTISLINIKDYFLFKKGISLTLSAGKKGELMHRMKGLLQKGSFPAMLAATFTLAIVANLYELLCTAGFPMLYTRLLTLNKLNLMEHYLYLLLYNTIYIIPLLIIMILFVITLGQRKLQEHEGRILKLQSGIMMLSLGLLLIFLPEGLNHVWLVFLLLLGSVAITWVITRLLPISK
jgi:thiol-disulfide isomerase/thioredoxin